jgi:O-antigen/teichoic acid export membrane protein
MSLLKKLASDTALYGLSTIVGRFLNYLLVPLYTQVFTTAEFGGMSKFYAYVAFLNVIYTFGMETTFFRYAKKENRQDVFNLIQSNIFINSLLISALLIGFSQPIAEFLGYPDKASFVIWFALIMAIDTLLAIPYALLRLENKAKRFAYTKIANIVINIGLNLFFLVFCRQIYLGNWFPFLKVPVSYIYAHEIGIGYVFLSNLIANALMFLMLYDAFAKYKFVFNWQKFKPMFWYGLPIMWMGLAGMVNMQLDKIMLEAYLPLHFYPHHSSLSAMGVYSACFRLATLMALAVQAFRYAAEPFFFSQAQDKQAPALFAKVMRYFVITCVVLWLAVSLHLDLLGWMFLRNPTYREGLYVVPVLLLGNLFLGVYYNLNVWFKLTDKTHYGTWITSFGALLTIVFNIALIPFMGYLGSAVAVSIAYFMMCWMCWFYGQKHFPIPYHIASAFQHIMIGSILCGIYLYLRIFFPMDLPQNGFSWTNLFINTGIGLVLFLGYLLFVFWSEKKNILKMIRR